MVLQKKDFLKQLKDGTLHLTGNFPFSHSQAKLVFEEMWKTGDNAVVCASRLKFLWFENVPRITQ